MSTVTTLFDSAPIKEMQRRGWIKATDDPNQIESELLRFFKVESLDQEPQLDALARKTDRLEPMNAAQRAWCIRARNLASALTVKEFSERSLNRAVEQVRRLAAWPEHARKVSKTLGDCGIRFDHSIHDDGAGQVVAQFTEDFAAAFAPVGVRRLGVWRTHDDGNVQQILLARVIAVEA